MGWNSIIYEQDSSDDILESLYKLRRWESEKLKTALDLYDMENHQKMSKPDDDQKFESMVNQKFRLRNFDARNERI